jgi:nitroreductase
MKNEGIDNLEPIKLLEPVFQGNSSVFEALKKRRTCRTISDKIIPLQILSDILWAAQGVNCTKGPFGAPGLTAGSASNSQEIHIYVAKEEGTYLYEPVPHKLVPVASGDIRTLAIGPRQGKAGANAPVRFIYVADIDKFKTAGFPEPGLNDLEIQKSYYFIDTGLVAQNVYLAAASLGLGSWFHNCNRAEITNVLRLKQSQRALFGQTIGYINE